jgi:hypothetical protein
MIQVAALFVVMLAPLLASPVGVLSLDGIADAPMLAVVRVERVGPDCTAKLKVLRSTAEIEDPLSLTFRCSLPLNKRMSGIAFEAYPEFHPGDIDMLPLRRLDGEWKLLQDRALGLLTSAIERDPSTPPDASHRDFLVAEITNLLLHGSYADLYRFSQSSQDVLAGTFGESLLTELTHSLPAGDARWLDISTALLASMGIPRVPLDTLMEPTTEPTRVQRVLLACALKNIPADGRREAIIRAMLRRSRVHDWGTAATLVPEFRNDPLLMELLPGYIERAEPGALYIAMLLVRNERPAILTVALPASVKALRAKDTIRNDAQAAAFLLAAHGDDSQFTEFLRIFKTAQSTDLDRYWIIWQHLRTAEGPRLVRMAAIAITDERVHSGDVRYCDIAASNVQTATGQDFGITGLWTQGLAERERAVSRVRAWITRQEQQ